MKQKIFLSNNSLHVVEYSCGRVVKCKQCFSLYRLQYLNIATAGASILATPLWGMLYADDAGVVLQSPEQPKNMVEVIVVVCAAFGLTVSEAKTEIVYLRAKGLPESTATFSVEAADQMYNQTSDVVCLGGSVNHNVDLFIEVNRRIRNARCSFPNYTLELYDLFPSLPHGSITVSSAWELISVSMCYSQGDGVNTSLSRLMYCTHE